MYWNLYQHKDYEFHSYLLSVQLKEKYDIKLFLEKDCLNKDKLLDKYIIGIYFKLLFLSYYNLKPTYAIILFNK